jgi:hypothetical protein
MYIYGKSIENVAYTNRDSKYGKCTKTKIIFSCLLATLLTNTDFFKKL